MGHSVKYAKYVTPQSCVNDVTMTKTKAFWQSAEQHTDKYKDAEDRPERVGARKDDGMKAGTARPIGVGKSPRKTNGRRRRPGFGFIIFVDVASVAKHGDTA